jgi:hypothetical protein
MSVAILVILGLIGVYNAREDLDHKNAAAAKYPPKVGLATAWHEGFAIDECGKILPNIKTNKDPEGLTTKGNGIIYIKPTKKAAAGHNATLGRFASDIGMKLNAGELQTPGGKLYQDGDNCEGSTGHVYVEVWSNPAEPQSDGVVQTTKNADNLCQPDCDAGALLRDDQLVTIAFLPAGKDNKPPTNIPLPPKTVISALAQVEQATTTTTTAPTASPSTTTSPVSTTTAPGGKSSSTTAPGGKPSSTTTPNRASSTTTTPAKSTTTAAKST